MALFLLSNRELATAFYIPHITGKEKSHLQLRGKI
jgi:hypothetical protein